MDSRNRGMGNPQLDPMARWLYDNVNQLRNQPLMDMYRQTNPAVDAAMLGGDLLLQGINSGMSSVRTVSTDRPTSQSYALPDLLLQGLDSSSANPNATGDTPQGSAEFADLASASAAANGRPFMIKFSSEGCTPCREMEGTGTNEGKGPFPQALHDARMNGAVTARVMVDDNNAEEFYRLATEGTTEGADGVKGFPAMMMVQMGADGRLHRVGKVKYGGVMDVNEIISFYERQGNV